MRSKENIRYYSKFPWVIPIWGAGFSRVTHPFAGFHSRTLRNNCFSLDLHALSAPPTFVLSQDQTLHRSSSMRTILCPCRSTDQEFFSSLKRMRPCEDESSLCMTLWSYEDGSSMCMTIGLYVRRSFHRSGRSDGHITLTVRSPQSGIWRQAPVNLNHLSCDSRLKHCSVVKEPGSSAHSTRQSAVDLTVYHRSRANGSGRIRPETELYLALRRSSHPFRTPHFWGGSTPSRRCEAVGKHAVVPTGRIPRTFSAISADQRITGPSWRRGASLGG